MDPISEMFSQIKNSQKIGKKNLRLPFSKFKMAILGILKTNHQITDFKKVEDKKFNLIEVCLTKDKFNEAKRVSKPGRRFYTDSSHIPKPKNPRGLVIISTPEGVMNGEDARKQGLGGEIIAEIS